MYFAHVEYTIIAYKKINVFDSVKNIKNIRFGELKLVEKIGNCFLAESGYDIRPN